MDEPKDIEAWADALLDQHRTAPRSVAPPVATKDLPPMVRLAVRLGAEPPDAERLERLQRLAKHQARFANLEATASLVGIVLLCLFAFAFLSGF